MQLAIWKHLYLNHFRLFNYFVIMKGFRYLQGFWIRINFLHQVRPIILNLLFMVNSLHQEKISQFTAWILIIICWRKNMSNYSFYINTFFLSFEIIMNGCINVTWTNGCVLYEGLESRQVGPFKSWSPYLNIKIYSINEKTLIQIMMNCLRSRKVLTCMKYASNLLEIIK